MALCLPEKCPRNRTDCFPLSQIVAEGKASFICCGIGDEGTRSVEEDCFRFCWHNAAIDHRDDMDCRDVIDTVLVLAQALSIKANMDLNSRGEEEKHNDLAIGFAVQQEQKATYAQTRVAEEYRRDREAFRQSRTK